MHTSKRFPSLCTITINTPVIANRTWENVFRPVVVTTFHSHFAAFLCSSVGQFVQILCPYFRLYIRLRFSASVVLWHPSSTMRFPKSHTHRMISKFSGSPSSGSYQISTHPAPQEISRSFHGIGFSRSGIIIHPFPISTEPFSIHIE